MSSFIRRNLGKLVVFLLVLMSIRAFIATQSLKQIITKYAEMSGNAEKLGKQDLKFKLSKQEKSLMTNFSTTDWARIGQTLRLFKKVHNHVWDGKGKSDNSIMVLEQLETIMFNWLRPSYKSTIDLRKSFQGKGKGIVVCAGNNHTLSAISTLRMIRELHGVQVPIEIFHIGDADLNAANRLKFESLGNTCTKDITKVFDNTILKLKGWAIKPFALLASSFAEPMLC